jgi:hypothetical protein
LDIIIAAKLSLWWLCLSLNVKPRYAYDRQTNTIREIKLDPTSFGGVFHSESSRFTRTYHAAAFAFGT